MIEDIRNNIIYDILLPSLLCDKGQSPVTFTPSMLKFARNNYEKDTGIKNSVQEMLRNTGDLKGLAEWGNKHATGLLPFGLIGPYYLNNK